MSFLPGIQQGWCILVCLFFLVGEFKFQVVAGIPQQVDAVGLVVDRALVVFTGGNVVVVTVLLVTFAQGDLSPQAVHDAKIEDTVHVVGAVILDTGADLGAQFTGGLGVGNIDQAANSVATKQGALRSTQYLNTFQVNTAQQRARVGAQENAIDHHPYGRVKILFHIRHADAADEDGGDAARTLGGVIDDQVG